MQGGGGRRLGLAQIRQVGSRLGLLARGLGDTLAQRADRGAGALQGVAGGGQGGLGRLALNIEQDRLVAPDVGRQVLVASRLAGLLLQARMLGLEGRDDVVQALQVGLGRAQTQLRLVPSGMQPGDARGLFQQGPALGRLGIDQGADAALADQGGGLGTGRRIGEQQLHVPGPHVAAVDLVVGAAAALDAARDLERFVVVEGGRCRAVAVVEREHDLGDVARRPVGAAGEDDVVHLAAAHALGRGLAHGPAQGFDQVGLAAAVGADDTRQTLLNVQLGRVDEGLEAAQSELIKLDQIALKPPS